MSLDTRMLTVDPGANTGWAFWAGDVGLSPDLTGVLHTKGEDRRARLSSLYVQFRELVRRTSPMICWLEGVELWTGSLTSMTAGKTGDLFQLSYTVGGFAAICTEAGVGWDIIPARKWKGQLDKIAIHERIARALHRKYKEHEADAVAMGLALKGLL